MSETSEDKTKRKFVKLLDNNNWCFKLNLYFKSYDFRLKLSEHLRSINKSISRTNPDIGFLYRVCLNNTRKAAFREFEEQDFDIRIQRVTAPMITYFCLSEPKLPKLERISSIKEFSCSNDYKFTLQEFPFDRSEKYRSAVLKQKPHDINKYLAGNFQRYGELNRKKIPNRQALKFN